MPDANIGKMVGAERFELVLKRSQNRLIFNKFNVINSFSVSVEPFKMQLDEPKTRRNDRK